MNDEARWNGITKFDIYLFISFHFNFIRKGFHKRQLQRKDVYYNSIYLITSFRRHCQEHDSYHVYFHVYEI